MFNANQCYGAFQKSIDDYHVQDHVDTVVKSPFPDESFESLLYPVEALQIKRRIDKSNQDRTDMVEKMDDYFLDQFKHVQPKPSAKINSETPAWLLDRMSILLLKIYHMKEQTERKDVNEEHLVKCQAKLAILLEQKADMQMAFDQLMEDILYGDRKMKVYRQMKMYNDASLNPMLYQKK